MIVINQKIYVYLLINVDQGLVRHSWSEYEELQVFYSDTALVCCSLMGLIGLSDLGHTYVASYSGPAAQTSRSLPYT